MSRLFFNNGTEQHDVIEAAGVIEGTHTNAAPGESFVFRLHDRFVHVVKEDFDAPCRSVPDDAGVMPVVVPVSTGSRFQ